MSIDIQQIINSPRAVSLVFFLGKLIPTRLGYPICDLIANWMSTRRDSNVIQAVRVNQWVARGANMEKKALDKAVRETFRNNVRNLYELYHYIHHPEDTQRMMRLDPPARDLIERPEFGDHGLVIVGVHLSSFDLILQSLCQQGSKPLALTIPNPEGGRRVEYEMRRRTGMNLVPTSVSALRQAVKHLERGGIVLTGMDRPVPYPKYCPRFFGYPASLPIHHIYLALKARVPVLIIAALQQEDRTYHIMASEPIEMEHSPENETEILRNAEKVLGRAEDFIRLAPQQWNMPLPVWPQMLGKVPL
jgi:phosphatidylinositol dimannoside acyltransferase